MDVKKARFIFAYCEKYITIFYVKEITGELQHSLVKVYIDTHSFSNVGLKELRLSTIMIYGDLLRKVR